MHRPLQLLVRDQILNQVFDQPFISWVIEAASGSGKSVLANHIHADPRYVSKRVSVTKIEHIPAATAPGTMTIVDVTGAVDKPMDTALATLLSTSTSDSPVIALVRRAGPATRTLVDTHWSGQISGSDLWLTEDDIREFAETNLTPEIRDLVLPGLFDRTAGWPVAVAHTVDRARRSAKLDNVRRDLVNHRSFTGLLNESLTAMSPELRRAARLLALLPRFDDATADAVGPPGVLGELVDLGFPLVDAEPGWWTVPPPARRWLNRAADDDPKVTLSRDMLEPSVHAGRVLEAIEACIGNGQLDLGADLLANIGADDNALLSPDRVEPLVASLGPSAEAALRTFLVRSRTLMVAGGVSKSLQLLRDGRARATSMPDADQRTTQELRAEYAHRLYVAGDVDSCQRELQDLADLTVETALARRTETEAGMLALNANADDLRRAEKLLARSSELWRAAGQLRQAEMIQAMIAIEVMPRQARFRDALQILDRQVYTLDQSALERAGSQAHRSRLLAVLNEPAAAEEAILDAEHLSGLLGNSWIPGLTAVARGTLASLSGDAAEITTQVAVARAAYGELMFHPAGALILEEFAVAFARAGAAAEAAALILEAENIANADIHDLHLAKVNVACRVGDPQYAIRQLAEARAAGRARNWYYTLLESIAEFRAGNLARSRDLLAEADRTAHATNNPNGPTRCEPRFVEKVRDASRPNPTATPARPAKQLTQFHITLFGRFAVVEGGTELDLPPGQPQTLVKLLVLNGGAISSDAVIDTLWTDTSLDVGRRRLRNVLSRLRNSSALIVRRDGEMLRLAESGVSSDFATWWSTTSELLRATAADIADLTASAAAAEPGLLPSEPYAEWLQQPRRQFTRRYTRILDRLAEVAAEGGDVDLALEAMEKAAAMDPLSELRWERGRQLLQDHDRPLTASSWLSQRPAD